MFGLSVISGCLFGSGLFGLLCLGYGFDVSYYGIAFCGVFAVRLFCFWGCLVRLCSCEF